MQYFKSDYMEGAHPLILERLCQTNMEKTSGYGTDEYCASARRKIAESFADARRQKYILWWEVHRPIPRSLRPCFVRMRE